MRNAPLAPWILLLVLPLGGCCFMGTQRPQPGGTGASGTPAPRPAPTPGHACHLDVTVVFPATKLDGSPWDVGGGRPDPFVVILQDGARVGETDRVQDSTSGHWALDVACEHDRPLVVEAIDRDLSADDPADTIELPGLAPGVPATASRHELWGTGAVQFDVTVEYR